MFGAIHGFITENLLIHYVTILDSNVLVQRTSFSKDRFTIEAQLKKRRGVTHKVLI